MFVRYDGNLQPWETDGEPDVKMDTRFMKAFTQGFKHPTSGKAYSFSQIIIGNYLSIMPLTKQGMVVLTLQWKQGVRMVCPQFPGGALKEDEDLEEAARKKLLSETGYEAERIDIRPHQLHFFDSRCPNFYHVALATQCEYVGRPSDPDADLIQVVELTPLEFFGLMDRGELHEPSTYVAVLLALRRGCLSLP